MSALTVDFTRPQERNRLTVGLRIFVAIPHLIVAQVWGYLAQVLAVVQWFIVLFTGKRNQGIFDLQRSWLQYYARAIAYVWLLHDVFPPFGTDAGTVPVRSELTLEEPANRLTAALRLIWVIPAALLTAVLGIASFVLIIISWFAILFTGSQPQGMWEFIAKAMRYTLRTQAYGLLMTDTYPAYE